MNIDFTLCKFSDLVTILQEHGYLFQTFSDFIKAPKNKTVVMRHDVDRLPLNALKMAEMEHELGMVATYYFRAVPVSFDRNVMEEIAGMGHEIGYHYENADAVSKGGRKRSDFSEGGERSDLSEGVTGEGGSDNAPESVAHSSVTTPDLLDLAYEDFCENLARFREYFEIKTICMHGSPLSKYDNRMIWERYDYKQLGIVAEPYFDVDFNDVFYLTDTGRRWNNATSSVRDRVESGFDIPVRNTAHLIEMLRANRLPDKIMFNVHPQRWHDRPLPWLKELVGQNLKNVVKRHLVKRKQV